MRSSISGMKVKLVFQKLPSEMPRAIDGTIRGILTSTSRTVETNPPNFFLAMRIAIGKPMMMLITVTIPPRRYDNTRLCQYWPQIPDPVNDGGKVGVNTA